MKIHYQEILYMKNLNNDLFKDKLFINVEQTHNKKQIDKFKKLLFDIGLAIIKDEYLVSISGADNLDLEWE